MPRQAATGENGDETPSADPQDPIAFTVADDQSAITIDDDTYRLAADNLGRHLSVRSDLSNASVQRVCDIEIALRIDRDPARQREIDPGTAGEKLQPDAWPLSRSRMRRRPPLLQQTRRSRDGGSEQGSGNRNSSSGEVHEFSLIHAAFFHGRSTTVPVLSISPCKTKPRFMMANHLRGQLVLFQHN